MSSSHNSFSLTLKPKLQSANNSRNFLLPVPYYTMRYLSLILVSSLGLVLYALPSYCAPATLAATLPEGISSSDNLVALMSTNITSTYDLAKRDPCEYEPESILYHEYGTDACPPRFHLKHNGQCEDDPDASFFVQAFAISGQTPSTLLSSHS